MTKMFALAAFAALAIPALAGDSCLKTGYRCENACPLASQANVCRSYGTEAIASSKIAQADVSAVVVENLARI